MLLDSAGRKAEGERFSPCWDHLQEQVCGHKIMDYFHPTLAPGKCTAASVNFTLLQHDDKLVKGH